ncbi:MAG: hypothetical protein ABI330_10355 [Caldimonas sp.]
MDALVGELWLALAVVGDAERDDAAERLLRFYAAAELGGREVDAVENAQLLAGRGGQCAAVLAERLDVALQDQADEAASGRVFELL